MVYAMGHNYSASKGVSRTISMPPKFTISLGRIFRVQDYVHQRERTHRKKVGEMREADKARVETRMMNVPEVGHLNRSCILLNNPQQELIFRQLSHVANTQD